jgi:hypothetical protein
MVFFMLSDQINNDFNPISILMMDISQDLNITDFCFHMSHDNFDNNKKLYDNAM